MELELLDARIKSAQLEVDGGGTGAVGTGVSGEGQAVLIAHLNATNRALKVELEEVKQSRRIVRSSLGQQLQLASKLVWNKG